MIDLTRLKLADNSGKAAAAAVRSPALPFCSSFHAISRISSPPTLAAAPLMECAAAHVVDVAERTLARRGPFWDDRTKREREGKSGPPFWSLRPSPLTRSSRHAERASVSLPCLPDQHFRFTPMFNSIVPCSFSGRRRGERVWRSRLKAIRNSSSDEGLTSTKRNLPAVGGATVSGYDAGRGWSGSSVRDSPPFDSEWERNGQGFAPLTPSSRMQR